MTVQTSSNAEPKTFVAAWLYSLLFGYFGVDRFYLGKPVTAIFKFLTLGGFGVWYIYDLVNVLSGGAKAADGSELLRASDHRLMAWLVTAFVWVTSFTAGIFLGLLVLIPTFLQDTFPFLGV
jgi:hypothetical protein